jgi:hypothetical protein
MGSAEKVGNTLSSNEMWLPRRSTSCGYETLRVGDCLYDPGIN